MFVKTICKHSHLSGGEQCWWRYKISVKWTTRYWYVVLAYASLEKNLPKQWISKKGWCSKMRHGLVMIHKAHIKVWCWRWIPSILSWSGWHQSASECAIKASARGLCHYRRINFRRPLLKKIALKLGVVTAIVYRRAYAHDGRWYSSYTRCWWMAVRLGRWIGLRKTGTWRPCGGCMITGQRWELEWKTSLIDLWCKRKKWLCVTHDHIFFKKNKGVGLCIDTRNIVVALVLVVYC